MLINNTIIYSFCVISSHSVLGGGKKNQEKYFLHIIYASLFSCCETAMATSNRGSWTFLFFQKTSIVFTVGGGVMWEHRSITPPVPPGSGSSLPLGNPPCTGQNVTGVPWEERGGGTQMLASDTGEESGPGLTLSRLPSGPPADSSLPRTSSLVIGHKLGCEELR